MVTLSFSNETGASSSTTTLPVLRLVIFSNEVALSICMLICPVVILIVLPLSSMSNFDNDILGLSTNICASGLATQSVFLLSLNNKIKKVRKDSISIDTRFCEVAYDNELAFFLLVGDEKRFLMKANGQYRKIGENIVIPNISPEIVSQTLQGPCTISSEKKRIAWFSVYGDVMEIYDYSDLNNVALVKSHICTLPVFNSSDGSLGFQTKLSVSSVTSDDNYIYALYNERNLEQAAQNRAQAFFSKKVLLFDWNGTPRFIVELDRPIKSITYDKKRNMVLCLGLNNDLEYAVFGFPVDV